MKPGAIVLLSAQGLDGVVTAGLTTGWLKGWLRSAGAPSVEIGMMERGDWRACDAHWQLFIGSETELTAIRHELTAGSDPVAADVWKEHSIDNPPRTFYSIIHRDCRIVLLPCGDLSCNRRRWLSCFNPEPLQPLYVATGDALPLPLEPGLSASLSRPGDVALINCEGLLPEEEVVFRFRSAGLRLATAESCTAGGIAARIARVPGASAVLDRAWVTYSNQAKQQELGVNPEILATHGAVSEPVVREMAGYGVADDRFSLAVSGIAGPGGGSDQKPVGTIWLALARPGQKTICHKLSLSGSRCEIQSRTTLTALQMLLEYSQ